MSEKIYVSIDNERFEATGELLERVKADIAEMNEVKKAFETELKNREIAKSTALQKLTLLGLTEEEAKAVIGIA